MASSVRVGSTIGKSAQLAAFLLLSALGAVRGVRADTLVLRAGTVLQGTFAGGTPQTVKFKSAIGTAEIKTTEVVSLAFNTAAGGAAPAPATGSTDMIAMKAGSVVQGSYAGGTPKTVKFVTAIGSMEVKSKEIVSVSFSATPTAPPAAAAAAPAAAAPAAAAAAPAASAGPVTVPAGTVLYTRTIDPVSSSDKEGKLFGLVLDSDLSVAGKVVAKAGTRLYGKVESSAQAGRVAGKSELTIGLASIEIGGSRIPVASDALVSTGQGSLKKTARRAIVGTAIGGAVGGKQGAKRGAGAGAATTLLTPGQAVNVAPKSLLQFTLEQQVILPGS